MIIKFNVFGKPMSVLKKEHEWQLFNESDTGIRSRVYDVVIPSDMDASELASYLDDIYHEYSSEKHPKVIKLG
ncbi:hypothetical protein LP316_11735 [Thalassotalea sp. LPB0316]|uniref:DUF7661 family protein n=1 Tax=Thalassotalea sp. LPB0316 TaxID=2769490 RepID=UPI0018676499|nr:hypothetical protein [Thalassotalea sp. LPB0316]QOL24973.1 hypothetical protein LP316_11735 [Thalassotalea sp. LPB0316]